MSEHKPIGQHYPLWLIVFHLRLVLEDRISLRAAARVVSLVGATFCPGLPPLAWTTGRWWLLRLGLARLQQPKERADDWLYLTDFSVQIGKYKCLLVVGLRQAHLPAKGQCLRLQDLHLIHLALL